MTAVAGSAGGNPDKVVIVGGGQAGAEVAAALRLQGFAGSVTLVSDEAVLPYSRPPLSKGYLLGSESQEDLFVRSATAYRDHSIDVRTSIHVEKIDIRAREVVLPGGNRLPYDALVLATGSRPRVLPDERLLHASNVLSLRKLEDADLLRSRLGAGSRIVLVGGGYIGLEIASVARSQGSEVTVLEAMPRVLARVGSPELAEFLARVHSEEGVAIRTQARISDYSIDADGDVDAIILEDGERISLDTVLVGIGVHPNAELAEEAGLVVQDGIVVDEYLQTSTPGVYAIGDVARFPTGGFARRVESMPNAVGQATAVAASILGTATRFEDVPWFWSDQFDLKLQMVGFADGCDRTVVRGDISSGRTGAIFYLKENTVRAAEVISDTKTFALARRMVSTGVTLHDPSVLGDKTIPLRTLISARGVAV